MRTDDVCFRHELNNVLIKPPLNLNHSSLFCRVAYIQDQKYNFQRIIIIRPDIGKTATGFFI